MFHQLAYTSSSTEHDQTQFINEDLPRVKEKNHNIGVTGVLLFAEGTFFQVLEGDEATVRELYKTIAQDSRHTKARIVLERTARRRSFPGWAMGWRHIDAEHPLASSIAAIASTEGLRAHAGPVNGSVMELVDQYFRANWG